MVLQLRGHLWERQHFVPHWGLDATQRSIDERPPRRHPQKSRRGRRGGKKDRKSAEEWKSGLRLVTFSIQSSVFLTPVISTQSTRMESAAFNWSQRDTGLGLQIRYCRIDSILAKAANRFVSWQTQQIFHPGVGVGVGGSCLQAPRLDGISVAKSYWEQGTAYGPMLEILS